MFLEKIFFENFRNIKDLGLKFSPSINIFFGENAQGKTNTLEGISIISTLGSFRTRKIKESIREGEKKALLKGEVNDGYGENTLSISFSRDEKKVLCDGKQPASAGSYLSVFPTVFFGPSDMEMARGDQSLRRKYLDRAAFFEDRSYIEKLRRYKRALLQRNEALLKGMREIESWSEFLAAAGWEVAVKRMESLSKLRERISSIHCEISGGKEEVEIFCRPSWNMEEGPEGLKKALLESIEEDVKRGFTHHGPHRDKIKYKLGGREISEHGSQGQHRTLVLSMKLALLLWSKEKNGVFPAFLLDDPGSELDKKRLGFLGEFLDSYEGQVFIASVEENDIPSRGEREKKSYFVKGGEITAL